MESASAPGKTVSGDLNNCLFASGAALVLHGKGDLVDSDLAQLYSLSERQRAAIATVVVSDTAITGECFRYLAALPNLKALYANKTGVDDKAPFECLPKTLEIVNLDHTDVGDAGISKLTMAPNLYSIRLRNTKISHRGVYMLASMANLRDCDIDGAAVCEHTRQRLLNVIVLRKLTCYVAFGSLLCCIQLAARKLIQCEKIRG